MTRDEITRKQAEDYADKHGFRVPYDGSNNFYDETDVKASLEGFVAGAKWADKTVLDKATEWLEKNIGKYQNWEYNEFHQCYEYNGYDIEKMISDFKKAMKGGEK